MLWKNAIKRYSYYLFALNPLFPGTSLRPFAPITPNKKEYTSSLLNGRADYFLNFSFLAKIDIFELYNQKVSKKRLYSKLKVRKKVQNAQTQGRGD